MTRPESPDGESVRPQAEYLAALFTAVSWGAVVFAVDGLLTVVLDREPVPPGFSPYYGLLALVIAGGVLWVVLARSTLAPSPLLSALLGAAAVYLVLVASGLSDGLALAASQATSPFTLVAAGLAAITVVAFWAGMHAWRRRSRGASDNRGQR